MLAYRLPCKFGNRHKVGEAHILAQASVKVKTAETFGGFAEWSRRVRLIRASVKDNSARFPIFEMIHALRSFDSRECQSQKQNISDTRNNGRSAYSRCMRVSTKVQNQKIPSKARGLFCAEVTKNS